MGRLSQIPNEPLAATEWKTNHSVGGLPTVGRLSVASAPRSSVKDALDPRLQHANFMHTLAAYPAQGRLIAPAALGCSSRLRRS